MRAYSLFSKYIDDVLALSIGSQLWQGASARGHNEGNGLCKHSPVACLLDPGLPIWGCVHRRPVAAQDISRPPLNSRITIFSVSCEVVSK